ncbi:MAG: phosphoribosylamine--glycine ligase [Clostridia bacterium]|nr:phosphoribosylamine--glycine ligase [Clostridia bacterium]
MKEKLSVLLVGGGGREHAIATALKKSARLARLICAPGNAGIAQLCECFPVSATDIEGQVKLAKEQGVDLVFVAPDDPLVLGLCDRLREEGIAAFGPSAAAARIEGSKVFSKDLMKKYSIPTASYEVFDDVFAARAYLKARGEYPIVLKAEGLALGKGVLIPENEEEAMDALKELMEDKKFGSAGNRIVIEEFLTGPEVSVLAFCDGKNYVTMPAAQDHKRAFEGNLGPNTGGMGAFCRTPNYTEEIEQICHREIFAPTVRAMAQEGCPFTGVLYFGLMLTPKGPRVIEYNARFGDPETQAVLPLLESDFLEILLAVNEGRLDECDVRFSDKAAFCLVIASGGYPGAVEKGFPITGLDKAEETGATVYHAGTANKDGTVVTSGGRVLGVVTVRDTLAECRDASYAAASHIRFDKMRMRSDLLKDY